MCLRNREFISDYLAVLDCELVHDQQEHLFRITGDGVMLEKMHSYDGKACHYFKADIQG